MTRPEPKLREIHLCRRACVYVRQSTLVQVHDHQESTRRQYELCQRAHQLGWQPAQIDVVTPRVIGLFRTFRETGADKAAEVRPPAAWPGLQR